MPEGPELHLASLYVNKVCDGVVFTGAVRKSEVSKNPDVPFTCEAYRVAATSRGKEVKLTLTPVKRDDPEQRVKKGQADQPMDVVFRFGMSGSFRFTPEDELPKHAHLRFHTAQKPCRVLSYVDARRFGRWQPGGAWQPSRGPCVMSEYRSFRENVLSHLSDRAFDRPICEVLLNQKYFNGIGNYLRAEVLFRLDVPPFVPARTVLQGLESDDSTENGKPVKNEITNTKTTNKAKQRRAKQEMDDLLRLCHTVPLEVVSLGGKGYDPEKADYSDFEAWLQCYYVDGMKSIRDHNGRTMWFKGDPGPMVPKDSKSSKAKRSANKDSHDDTEKKKVAKNRSSGVVKNKVIKQETGTRSPKTEQDVRATAARPKRRETEVDKPPAHEKRSAAHRRKSSEAQPTAAAPQRQTGRVTRQSSK
ncbi:LOW QUALITY PROTEIN: endonuclease 8-like 1 [Brachionichthys hirsutus]|uniref:LOW QUALITY PROTEIN: endonuclease 8-like 1 n=1 Tax=Brachionichthys hirsutus TaxID=412623 RepID=UPI0036050F36